MPDMRDYIAMYLASGQGGQPQGGMPMGGGPPGGGQPVQMPGWPTPPPGGYPPPTPMPGPQGPNPGGTVPPPPPEFYRGGRGLFEPDPAVPSNLQDYQQLPSGQFLPDQQPPPQMPTLGPGDMPGPQEPPADTPMQAPQGQLVGGMDPQQWLRMYRGG